MTTSRELPAAHSIEVRPLSSLQPNPRNAKLHDTRRIDSSLGQFGYVEPVSVDARTDFLISGHGRVESLTARKARGEPPPDKVQVDPDSGDWLIPVVTGWASKDDTEADAVLVTLNRLGEKGGGDAAPLYSILSELAEDAPSLLDMVGYTDAELEVLTRQVHAIDTFQFGADHMLDEFRNISGQDPSDYVAEYARKVVVYIRDEEAIADFSQRLGITQPLTKDLNYPLGWVPDDRRKRPAPDGE